VISSSTVSDTGIGINLSSSITQGDTDQTRDGDMINLTKVRLVCSGVYADTTNVMRIILFRWKPNSTPTWAELLEGATPGASDWKRPHRKDTASNFHIMYDRTLNLSSAGQPQALVSKTLFGKSLGKKRLAFSGGGTSGTDHIWLFVISDSATASHPNFDYSVTTYFTDS
jgi:hypothetical protein